MCGSIVCVFLYDSVCCIDWSVCLQTQLPEKGNTGAINDKSDDAGGVHSSEPPPQDDGYFFSGTIRYSNDGFLIVRMYSIDMSNAL